MVGFSLAILSTAFRVTYRNFDTSNKENLYENQIDEDIEDTQVP